MRARGATNAILLWRNIIDYLTVQLAGRKINRIKNATGGTLLRLRTSHCNLASAVTLRYFQLTRYITAAAIVRPDLHRISKYFNKNAPSCLAVFAIARVIVDRMHNRTRRNENVRKLKENNSPLRPISYVYDDRRYVTRVLL